MPFYAWHENEINQQLKEHTENLETISVRRMIQTLGLDLDNEGWSLYGLYADSKGFIYKEEIKYAGGLVVRHACLPITASWDAMRVQTQNTTAGIYDSCVECVAWTKVCIIPWTDFLGGEGSLSVIWLKVSFLNLY